MDDSIKALQKHYESSLDKYFAILNLRTEKRMHEGKPIWQLKQEQVAYNKMLDAAISEFRINQHNNKSTK